MKFTCTVDIDLSLEEVIKAFDDPKNLGQWQDGFISYEHLSGTPGEAGAKSRLLYKMRNQEMELIETIEKRNLPQELSGTYEHIHMTNRMVNSFKALNDSSTRYTAEIEYTKFNGFMPKLMAKLMPGMFKKQTQKWLNQFKEFAETGKKASKD